MKRCKKLLSALLAALLLVGAVPAYAANDDAEALNGSSGAWSEFDHSVYDTETTSGDFRSSTFEWPSSGTLLVRASATSASYTIAKFNGVKIPAGLIVDIYKYDGAGDTYTLLGHFDTTDGNPVTIGSSNSGNSNTANTPSVASIAERPSVHSISGNSGDFGKVIKTFTPGTPSASYSKSYDDVTPDLWCYDAIMTLTEGGLLGGYGNGKFGPNDALTRAQLTIIRSRLVSGQFRTEFANGTSINGYRPAKDHTVATRAFAAIRMAAALFDWDKISLTKYERSLIADSAGLSSNDTYKTMMYRPVYDAWRASLNKDVKYRSSIDQFPDATEIHKWIDENAELMGNVLVLPNRTHEQLVKECETYFLRAYNLGMFRGVDGQGTFNPYGSITRGQLCQALYNVGWTQGNCLNYQ